MQETLMPIDMGARLPNKSLKGEVSAEEWERRCELAAFFRLIAHYGLNTSPDNHITARVPGEPDHFLINPGKRMFTEITASNLVKIDLQGNILSDAPTGIINPAGFIIHGAVMTARPDISCSVHLHTVPGVAVAAQKKGLQHYSQESMRFYGKVGFHDYEGISKDMDEQERVAHDLADNFVLILRNHGSLVVGRTVAEAFIFTIGFEKSCEIQVAAQASGQELTIPDEKICEMTANHRGRLNRPQGADAWDCYRRIADAYYPSYAT
jgi:ribulose-5-phosphate 4-epimerase/fuculose-1-phosphate aldolase